MTDYLFIKELEVDIHLHNIEIPDSMRQEIRDTIKTASFKKKSVVICQTQVCNEMLFVVNGILASEYIVDGKSVISRFFVKSNFCSNIVSAASQDLALDNIIALTDVDVISMPFDWFIRCYLKDMTFGEYIRLKVMQNMLEAKNFISMKTISDTESKYQFLKKEYPEILQNVSDKYVAAFFGITPEGLSRFFKKRHEKS